MIKKGHIIYIERLIGIKPKTEFILSSQKLNAVVEDVRILKAHYKQIKELKKKQKLYQKDK